MNQAMKARTYLFIGIVLVLPLFTSSCSRRILEAKETHKLHDEYFILRKNGRYSLKMFMMGVLRMPDSERGRYLLSGDTVYFVRKTGRKTFETDGYGIIDSSSGTFFYRPNEKEKERQFDISEMHLRRDDR